jgi:hypothetical protein
MLVVGAVEVEGGTPRRTRLKVIEGFGKKEICAFVPGAVASTTKLLTDDWPAYRDIPEIKHEAISVGRWRPTSCCPGPTACSQTSSAGAWEF